MEDITKRRLITFSVFALIIIGVIAGTIYINTPRTISQSEQNIIAPPTPLKTAAIDGVGNLTRTGLTKIQADNVEQALSLLLEKTPDAKSLTIDIESIKNNYNSSSKHYIYSFNVTSDTKKIYSVTLDYLLQNGGIATIKDNSGTIIYSQLQD